MGRTGFDQIAVELTETKDVDKAGEAIISSLNEKIGLTEAYVSNDLAKQRASLMSMMDIVTLILSHRCRRNLAGCGQPEHYDNNACFRQRKGQKKLALKRLWERVEESFLRNFYWRSAFISAVGCVVGLGIGYTISFIGAGAFGIQLTVDWSFIVRDFSFFSRLWHGIWHISCY